MNRSTRGWRLTRRGERLVTAILLIGLLLLLGFVGGVETGAIPGL